MPGMENLFHDLRYALRSLRKSPGFTAAAIILLALGIGANTAVFSVVHAVLLRPLPYPQPDRLVQLLRGVGQSNVSIPEYQFWSQHASAFASVAGCDQGVWDISLDTGAAFEWIKVTRVTENFLKTLGVAPSLGREFNADETRPNGPQAILLSDSLWRRMFAGDPKVLGRAVTLGKTRYTITGVLPRDFWFASAPDAFLSLQPSGTASDTGTNTEMIARLKPGVSITQAEAEKAALTQAFLGVVPMELPPGYSGLTPVSYQTVLTGDQVRTNLLLLSGAVGLLLLIACSNLASLLLARVSARGKEIAVRLALGSSTRRLLWQSLLESLLLSTAGGLFGLLVAAWLLKGLLNGLPSMAPFSLHVAGAIGLDRPVLWFTFAVALGTSLLFSIAPLAASSRMDISATLKSGNGGGTGRVKTRSILVAGQVALTVTLLVSAALLIQTLYRLHRQELGFSPQGAMTFLTPPSSERDPSAARAFESALLDGLKSLPGIRSAAGVNALPLDGQYNFPTQRDGHPEQSIGGMEIRRVSPEFFEAMGVRVARGRPIFPADRASAPPVILVNETLARQWWATRDPLGDRIVIGRYKGKDYAQPETETPRQIVGVIADTRGPDLTKPARPTVYIPIDQSAEMSGYMSWVLRGTFPPGFAERLRQAVAQIDPRQRVDRIRTMQDIVEASTAPSRFDAWLFGIFAGVALLLTSAGIYGVLAFSVARRTREIGMRMALGASRRRVIRMVLRQAFALIVIGLAVGLAGAAMVARSLSSLLFNVRPGDPFSYAAVAALLLAVGCLASYLPARRAARVDPMVALRQE
jgi:putative ABC transport system permease protein